MRNIKKDEHFSNKNTKGQLICYYFDIIFLLSSRFDLYWSQKVVASATCLFKKPTIEMIVDVQTSLDQASNFICFYMLFFHYFRILLVKDTHLRVAPE